ncbi:hypothetical protein WICPIJ_001250 [Wickerhamomyces pijperi]|uniref:Peroxisome assembly protein 12 n=1 Tax=Wickerhamomyces pijperi TaxID=599730 RepID=A0A9P8TQT2_WICPI|nr:hypothetical protein WICPIJ_001250 [Wickerhamomyces pijperi]
MDYYNSLDPRSLSNTPTIFEILSTQELQNLITPSLKYLLINIIERNPSRYGLKLALSFDELNFLGRSVVEYFCLNRDNSSFVEKFYGLTKVCKTNLKLTKVEGLEINEDDYRLNQTQVIVSVLKLTGGEYLNEKFEIWFNQWYSKVLLKKFNPKESTWLEYFKYLLIVKIVPFWKQLYSAGNVLMKILYLARLTNSTDLIDYLFKINTTRSRPTVPVSHSTAGRSSSNSYPIHTKPSFQQNVLHILRLKKLGSIFRVLVENILPFSIFLLKFLEWFNSSDFIKKITSNSTNTPSIPPPPPANTPTTTNKECPICDQEITTPTIIETGYVFCYVCIHDHLTEQAETSEVLRCPITGKRLLHVVKKDGEGEHGIKAEGLRRLMI